MTKQPGKRQTQFTLEKGEAQLKHCQASDIHATRHYYYLYIRAKIVCTVHDSQS